MADAGKIVITPKGAYSSTKTYEWLDEVSYNGNAYVALKTVTGVTPSDDGVNWRLFMSSTDVDANVLVPKFTEASTRSNIVSGENLSTMFGKIKKWFTDLKSHAFKDLVNNLTTSTTGSALDASQGKVLQDEVDGVNRNLDTLGQGECSGSKNVLDLRGLQEKTINGVTFTPYNDKNGFLKYINVNGTATDDANYVLLNNGVYDFNGMILSGCPSGGAWNKYNVTVIYNQGTSYKGEKSDVGNGVTINNEYTHSQYMICVKSGITVSNLKFYPMIRPASVSDSSYEPYFMSNSMLTKEVDSIKNDLSTHTHNYAGSDTPGGPATYALQANKDGAGNVIDATYINKTYMRNYGAGSIAFGNNMFIGIFNGDIICSSDGKEWEVNFEPNLFSLLDNDEILLGITYGNEKFVSFSNKGCSYVSSDNGNTWTKTQTIITV